MAKETERWSITATPMVAKTVEHVRLQAVKEVGRPLSRNEIVSALLRVTLLRLESVWDEFIADLAGHGSRAGRDVGYNPVPNRVYLGTILHEYESQIEKAS